MKLLTVILGAFIFEGCSTLTIEQIEARDWKQSIDRENWELCDKAYRQHSKATIHLDHQHGKRDRIKHWMIKSDLLQNNCKMVLGEYWAEY